MFQNPVERPLAAAHPGLYKTACVIDPASERQQAASLRDLKKSYPSIFIPYLSSNPNTPGVMNLAFFILLLSGSME